MCVAVVRLGVHDSDGADHIAVFLAEKRHGAFRNGLLARFCFGLHHIIGCHGIVDDLFHFFDLLGRHAVRVVEVKAQTVGGYQRAGLARVLSQHLVQGRVHQVGGGMVAHDVVAPLVTPPTAAKGTLIRTRRASRVELNAAKRRR